MELIETNIHEIKIRIGNVFRYLHGYKEYINKLNVFPVPDGDTGLNMTLTIQGALANMPDYKGKPITMGEYLKVFAEQMLMSSRGCSGVILALYCKGITEIIGQNDFSSDNLFKAFENGYKKAYEGTENPKEGTILTIMYEFKEKFGELMKEETDALVNIRKCIPYLKTVLDKTPDMLPVLKQAGVVDSGGAGFIILLEGIDREIKKSKNVQTNFPFPGILKITRNIRKFLAVKSSKFKTIVPGLHVTIRSDKLQNTRLNNIIEDINQFINSIKNNGSHFPRRKEIVNNLKDMEEVWTPKFKQRYCLEFVLKSDKLSTQNEMKAILDHESDNLIILKSDSTFKVHIHTNKPDLILKEVSRYGEFIFTKVDDMKEQHQNFISEDRIDYEREKCVFCLVAGEGFKAILKNLGADEVYCYRGIKPSVKILVKELNRLKSKNIIATADDKDILMALKSAASLSKSNVHIIETNNVFAIINLVMSISNDYDITDISGLIINQPKDIRYCGISRAVRNTKTTNGNPVKEGDFFCVFNNEIMFADKDPETVIIESIKNFINTDSLVTLFKGIHAKNNKNILSRLTRTFPGISFEEYYGGQYQYYYYINFEH